MYNKNILIVSKSFYPKISPRSFRTTELAKELSRKGHYVTVLIPTEEFDYSKFEKKFDVIVKNFGKLPPLSKIDDGLKIFSRFKKILRGILTILIQYPSIGLTFKVNSALKREKDYDILISIAAPHSIHWGVALAYERKKKIAQYWVADCGDPFMGAAKGKYTKMFYFKYVEKWFCKKPDFITVPIDEAINGYFPEFRNKIKVIPQGYQINGIKTFGGKIQNKIPTFAFAGSLFKTIRDPKDFFNFLCKIENKFKFILYTNNKEFLDPYKKILKNKIDIRKKIPRKKLIYELSKMNFLINFENKSDVQIPSKLIDYSITGRPILNISTSNFNDTEFNEFLRGDYSNRFKINNLEDYEVSKVANKFLNLTLN